jgi:RHS repeat-associated protein
LQGAGGIGGLLARTDFNGSADYHTDGNGNVTMLLDANQNVAAKYLYDPYGNTLAMSGQLASANVYRFSSKEWNANAGLYYYLYRFYDSNLQRWPNRDPLGNTLGTIVVVQANGQKHTFRNVAIETFGVPNLYAYVANNPVNYVDPLGLWQLTINFGAGLGIRFTIGNNGGTGLFNGQWSEGVYVGVGEGFAADLDVFNRGCHAKGANWGTEGSGEIGLGPHVEGESHVGSEPWWNVNYGVPGTPFGGSVGTEGVTVPTIGVGEAAVVGVGGTFYY